MYSFLFSNRYRIASLECILPKMEVYSTSGERQIFKSTQTFKTKEVFCLIQFSFTRKVRQRFLVFTHTTTLTLLSKQCDSNESMRNIMALKEEHNTGITKYSYSSMKPDRLSNIVNLIILKLTKKNIIASYSFLL